MTREEFMKELEYLLSDIPDEEKADAIGYYRDYLEEAGQVNEAQAMRAFGSPERIAAIIRSDLSGNLEEGGEFTETGYEDERFRDPNFQVVKRFDLPETSAQPHSDTASEKPDAQQPDRREPWTNRTVKILLWVLLIIVAAPVLFGIGGGFIGLLGGLFGILVAAVVVIGVLTVTLLITGVGCFIGGIVCVVIHPLNGMLLIGLSILVLGFAMLSLALCFVFYGKFLPFLLRSVVNGVSRLFQGRRTRS